MRFSIPQPKEAYHGRIRQENDPLYGAAQFKPQNKAGLPTPDERAGKILQPAAPTSRS